MTAKNGKKATALNEVSNGAEESIILDAPYNVEITLEGTAAFLYHRWNVEALDKRAHDPKGGASKKTDDVESYVWRDSDGMLSIPAEYLRMSIVHAAKYKQDPRSPKKSAMDLVKAGLICVNELCPTGYKDWQFIDRRRAVVQRSGITRSRPALLPGWRISAMLRVLLPQYLSPHLVNELAQLSGMLVGLGDNRPSYGRFQVVKFDVIPLEV